MSWNNVIPAWCLFPHRVRCHSNRNLSQGFDTREELEAYIENNPDEDFEILSPLQGD